MILAYIQSIEDDNKRRIVEDIYDLYYKHMTACALNILRNYHDSQDAVQDAFYNITATYELFADAAAPATASLVHIYVKNTAINIYNKNKRHSNVATLCDNIEEVAKDVVDEDADVQRIVIDNETTKIISEAVDKLDDKLQHNHIRHREIRFCMKLNLYSASMELPYHRQLQHLPCWGQSPRLPRSLK